MGFLKRGGEFLVNTTTHSGQSESAMTTLTDGHFVVTWMDGSAPYPDMGNIRAQLFDANGARVGGEFLVNSTTHLFQDNCDVTALSAGRFVVTWTDQSATGGDTSLYAVRGQMFNADGSRLGDEFLVNTITTGIQDHSGVVPLSNGGFAVTWTDDGGNSNPNSLSMRGQIFGVGGTPMSGGDFLVGTTVAPFQSANSSAALSDGRFVVTWTSSQGGVRGQIFDSLGAKIGGDFPASPASAVGAHQGSVTGLDDGRFLVTWTDSSMTGGDTSSSAVRGQIFSSNGSTIGLPFLVNTTAEYNQFDSHVSALADGRFVVTWTGDDGGATYAQVFAADGTKSGREFIVNTTTPGTQDESNVTALDDGGFVVSWTDASQTGDDKSLDAVRAQIFDATHYVGDATAEIVSGGSFDDTIRGEGGNDLLRGYDGKDLLIGGIGIDKLAGGGGNDTFEIVHGDVVAGEVYNGGGGSDRLVGYDEQAYFLDFTATTLVSIEQVDYGGVGGYGAFYFRASQIGTGLAATTTIQFNAGDQSAELLEFQMRDATSLDLSGFKILGFEVFGTEEYDDVIQIVGDSDNETIIGTGVGDRIHGNAGNDTLDGGLGADELLGGLGNDVYVVDNPGDTVREAVGEGTDRVRVASLASYTLNADVSVEILQAHDTSSTAALALAGNAFSQTIVGNAGANTLIGGGGRDTMRGLKGDDIYVVGDARDEVQEAAGQGADSVATTVSFALKADVSVEMLYALAPTATTPIKLTGNSIAQTIIGNAGDNTLDDGGAAGADTLVGLAGNDTYVVRNTGATIVETSGGGTLDHVRTAVGFVLAADDNIEQLSAVDAAAKAAIDLTGNGVAQTITGNAGVNRLDGQGGADILTGLGGKDTFVFSTAPGAGNIDRITDFNLADDTIELDSAIFVGLTAGALAPGAFKTFGTADADDRILYNQSTGALYYDQDGSGTAFARVQFAVIDTKVALTAADFVVV